MSVPDLTFHGALRARLGRLTPPERAVVLAECLHLLCTVLPRLEPPEQRTLALSVAAALEAADCPGEAAALRLCVGGDPPPRAHQHRRGCGRRWSDRCWTYVLD